MSTDHERIGAALEFFTREILPFFEGELRRVHGDRWIDVCAGSFRNERVLNPAKSEGIEWDAQAILAVMWDQWNAVFRNRLSILERSFVSELREVRNRWAHQTRFSNDDSFRTWDTVERLLLACGNTSAQSAIDQRKFDILRDRLSKKINDDLARARTNRQRLLDAALFIVCAFAISVTVYTLFGEHHWGATLTVIMMTTFTFGYLIYQRLHFPTQEVGVHECAKCKKIIYTEVCPYCEPTSISGGH